MLKNLPDFGYCMSQLIVDSRSSIVLTGFADIGLMLNLRICKGGFSNYCREDPPTKIVGIFV